MTDHRATFTIWSLAQLPGRKLGALQLALMLLIGMTEGIGILLLIPLLPMLESGLGGGALPGLNRLFENMAPDHAAGILLAGFVGIVLARAMAQYWNNLVALKVEIAIIDQLRERAVAGLLGAEWRTISAMRQSDNATLLITTIDRLSYAVSQSLTALTLIANIVILLVAALFIAPQMAIAALILSGIILLAYRGFRRRAENLGKELDQAFRGIHARLDESLAGLRLIKSFGREEATRDEVSQSFRIMRTAQSDYVRVSGFARLLLQLLGASMLALFVWLAVFRFGQSALTLVPLVALFGRCLMLLNGLQDAWQECRYAAPALGDLNKLLKTTEAHRENQVPSAETILLENAIELRNVSVSYRDGQPALSNVSLSLPKGQCTMLSGPSGAGKSTLADIVAGLLQPGGGHLLIDGQDIGADRRSIWRRSVAYVQQEPLLFNASIADNLRWAVPDASERMINAALLSAKANFISSLPEGLATQVGDKGHHLSGGERQRIALARALLCDPQLLILDEATSAVDSETESAIHDALDELKGSTTIFIIGHRSTLAELADVHFVLETGKLVVLQG